jgi:hypothetical protein
LASRRASISVLRGRDFTTFPVWPEFVRDDDLDLRFGFIAAECSVLSLRIILKIVVEFAENFCVITEGRKRLAGGPYLIVTTGDEDVNTLVRGGNIEAEAEGREIREIRDGSFYRFAFGLIFPGDFFE